MGNFGRGWAEGYGHQSAEAMDAQHDRDMAEAEQNRYLAELERSRREKVARASEGPG